MNDNTNTKQASPFRGPGGERILIIDNYDSFTYNLVHLVNEIGLQCEVWRNDKFAIDDVDNSVMALRHNQFDVRGVQFHPESVLTEYGKELMQNWLAPQPPPAGGGVNKLGKLSLGIK